MKKIFYLKFYSNSMRNKIENQQDLFRFRIIKILKSPQKCKNKEIAYL